MDYDALEKRLREPPFGTETSERNLMAAAAATIAELRARNDALRVALADHNDALRSACAVAHRNGAETNWLSLRGRIHWVLAEHHELTNEARAALAANKEG